MLLVRRIDLDNLINKSRYRVKNKIIPECGWIKYCKEVNPSTPEKDTVANQPNKRTNEANKNKRRIIAWIIMQIKKSAIATVNENP